MYQQTTAVKKILKCRKRIRAVSGGTGAAKTVAILQWLIDYAQCHHSEVIDVVSESYPHLDLGAIAEFKRILIAQNYWDDKRWNGGAPRSYTFETGSVISFVSFDTVGKAHGPRRDVLFINECNNLSWPIVDQLITRTKKIIWLDWNPTEDFWFDEEVWGKRDDVEFFGENGTYPPLTFEDNEGLDAGQRNEILAHKNNYNWWRVYGLGLKGQLTNRIYTGWQIIDSIPHEARLERYGLDFGFTNDPTAIVALYYYNGGYIVDEICYQKGLSNKQIADILINQPKALVVADSAEPKSIAELQSFGISVIPCTKGRDSVNAGIQIVQAQKISVTRRSPNILKEQRNYLWLTNQDGRILNEPSPIWNHCMDALRYAFESLVPVIRNRELLDLLYTPPHKEHRAPR